MPDHDPLTEDLRKALDAARAQTAEVEADNQRLRDLLRSQAADADSLEAQNRDTVRRLKVIKAAHESAVAKLDRERTRAAVACGLVAKLAQLAEDLLDDPDAHLVRATALIGEARELTARRDEPPVRQIGPAELSDRLERLGVVRG